MMRTLLATTAALLTMAAPSAASTLTYTAEGGYVLTGTAGPDSLASVRAEATEALTFTDTGGTITLGSGVPADCKATTPSQVDCATGADRVTLAGADGDDILDGTDGDDVLRPGLGDDDVTGQGGFDTLDHSADGRTQGIEVVAESGPEEGDLSRGYERLVLTEHDDFAGLRTVGANLTVDCGAGTDAYDPGVHGFGTYEQCERQGTGIGRFYAATADLDREAARLFKLAGRTVSAKGSLTCAPEAGACRVRLSLSSRFKGPNCDVRTQQRGYGSAEFKLAAGESAPLAVDVPRGKRVAAKKLRKAKCLSLRVGVVKPGNFAAVRDIFTGKKEGRLS